VEADTVAQGAHGTALATQGAAEYELSKLLQQVQCLGLIGACDACSHCWAAAWELSGLDRFHAATPQRVSRASCPALCAWRRLLLICLKLLVGVCVVRDGLGASVCVCLTFAASVDLLPRGWRAVAFPCWRHVQSCSTWLIPIVRCCFGGLCVRDGLAASVSACRTSAASVELLPRGWRAVAFPWWLHVLICSTWLIVCCGISGSLCFCVLIGANNSKYNTEFHPPSCVLWLLKRCLCCRGRRYSCCATLIMLWLSLYITWFFS